jgi:hypothetical protein
MRRVRGLIVAIVLIICLTGVGNAALTTIGTATYQGTDYNLIWDDDNNGNSVVWLDYTNRDNWDNQIAWAAGLGNELTNINTPGYSITWDDHAWRLPSTVDGPYRRGYDGTTTAGYNITTSEMGHLYYEELGNLGYYDTSGNSPQTGWGLQQTGDFDNLIASWYWSGTEYADNPDRAWLFYMSHGYQHYEFKSYYGYGLAVRSGHVSAVPVPGAVWLLGSGLTGLAALGRRKKGNRS